MAQKLLRDTVVETDLRILSENISVIKNMIGPGVCLAAVVKADAYGLGAAGLLGTLKKAGVGYLAVAVLSEALALRKTGTQLPILIMGHTPDDCLEYAVENDITVTLTDLRQAELLNALGKAAGTRPKCHLKLDTGFHRLGFDCSNSEHAAEAIASICALPHIDCEGLFSHLALAGEVEDCEQFRLFTAVADRLHEKGIRFRYRHIADSIAAVDYPEYRLDMVRVGALMYGMQSSQKHTLPVRQAVTFRSRISQLHSVPRGAGVSYDYLWHAKRDSVIATVPFGYADGYPRNLRDGGYVTVRGQKCPFAGVICMDQAMIDVTDVPGVCEGDDVIIYGSGENEMTIAEAAALAGTNKNDILARLAMRAPRIYKND